MEPNNNEKIVSLLDRVINLLAANSHDQWAGFLRNAKKELYRI